MSWRAGVVVTALIGALAPQAVAQTTEPALHCELRPGISLGGVMYAFIDQATADRSWEVAFEWDTDGDVDEDREIEVSWSSRQWSGTAVWDVDGPTNRCSAANDAAVNVADWADRARLIDPETIFPESVSPEDVDVNADVADLRLALYEILSRPAWVDALGVYVAALSNTQDFEYVAWAISEIGEDWSVIYRYTLGGDTEEIRWRVNIDEHEVVPMSRQSSLLWALFPPPGEDAGTYSASREFAPMEELPETLSRPQIQETINDQRRRIMACGSGIPRGRYPVSFAIQPDGTVDDVTFDDDNDVDDRAVWACLVDAVGDLSFPAFSDEDPIEITYPFMLGSSDEE